MTSSLDQAILELQALRPGAFGERFHAPMILVSTTVEDNLLHALFQSTSSQHPSHQLCLLCLAQLPKLLTNFSIQSGCRKDGMTDSIINELRVDMPQTAKNVQALLYRTNARVSFCVSSVVPTQYPPVWPLLTPCFLLHKNMILLRSYTVGIG